MPTDDVFEVKSSGGSESVGIEGIEPGGVGEVEKRL